MSSLVHVFLSSYSINDHNSVFAMDLCDIRRLYKSFRPTRGARGKLLRRASTRLAELER